MGSIIKRMLKQRAVYWAPDVADRLGQSGYATPIVVKCRWEDKSEEFISPAGTREVSNSKVYLDTDVAVNGYLVVLLGGAVPPKTMTDEALLNTLVSKTDPTKNDAYQILKFEKTPDLRAKNFIRLAIL